MADVADLVRSVLIYTTDCRRPDNTAIQLENLSLFSFSTEEAGSARKTFPFQPDIRPSRDGLRRLQTRHLHDGCGDCRLT